MMKIRPFRPFLYLLMSLVWVLGVVSCVSTDNTLIRNPNGSVEDYVTLRRIEGRLALDTRVEITQQLPSGAALLVTAVAPAPLVGIVYTVYLPSGKVLTRQTRTPVRFVTTAEGPHRIVVQYPASSAGAAFTVKLGQSGL